MHVILRDGRAALLRRSTPEDAPAVHALNHAVVAAGRGVVQRLDELPPSPDYAREQLAWFADHPRSLHLVAELEGRLVGAVDIRRPPWARVAHNGLLTLGIHPDAQAIGLGRALMDAALAWADADGVLRIDLYVLGDNERALALYRSCGFREGWRRERFLRGDDGTFVADLVMVRER